MAAIPATLTTRPVADDGHADRVDALTEPLPRRILSPPMHRHRELQSLEMHRRIAALLEREPAAVLNKALANLDAWQRRRPDATPSPAQREWRGILTHTPPAAIAALLRTDDERSNRLRQSSPFAGVLSPREVWAIKRDHAAV